MREYKFRGWDAVGDKGWVYGDLVHNKKVTDSGLADRVMVGGYEVVPESVGISTGLSDCDGLEIFEGDIIRIYDNNCEEYSDQQVRFAHGVFGVDNWSKKCLTTLSFFMGCNSEYSVGIIGNAYENKDMIK